jgi:type I restriction enzyme S subunit
MKGNSTTLAYVDREGFETMPILLPPLPEQEAIVQHLEEATANIDAAIDRHEREITLLREYRTRLVADVVTGKLDVREAAARLPHEVAPKAAEDDTDPSDEAETGDEEAVA